MKNVLKIFVLLFVTTCAVACVQPTESDEVYVVSKDVVFYRYNDGGPIYNMSVMPFEYNGHKYLMFGGGESKAIVHDPDCPCGGHHFE